TWTHPLAGLQLSSVQTLLSLQLSAGPGVQTPPWHVSPFVHALLSVHDVPFGWEPSVGQLLLVPSQNSATSHGPLAARHRVPAFAAPSGGQLALEPEQVSATSQTPEAGRQIPPVVKPSGGHVVLTPSQNSAASQMSAAVRQRVPAFPATWTQTWSWLQVSTVHG